MRCRRICRELLWLSRFGELGPSSQPHLDHLAGCRGCRDEVGFDRAMVEQLRIALAARIENAAPSPRAFDSILARAQAPEPAAAVRIWQWSTAVVGRLRFATAMAGTGLALVLALNTQVVGVPSTDAGAEWERSTLQQVPRVPREQSALAQLAEEWGSVEGSGGRRPDPEAVLTLVGRPPAVTVREQPAAEPAEQPAQTELRLVIRPLQTPEPATKAAGPVIEPEVSTWRLATSQPGEPS